MRHLGSTETGEQEAVLQMTDWLRPPLLARLAIRLYGTDHPVQGLGRAKEPGPKRRRQCEQVGWYNAQTRRVLQWTEGFVCAPD